jgi:hypothetical protein
MGNSCLVPSRLDNFSFVSKARMHLEVSISSGDFSLPNFNRILNFQLYVILKLWEVHLLARNLEFSSGARSHNI